MMRVASWRTVVVGVACVALTMLATASAGAAQTRPTPLELSAVGQNAELPQSAVTPRAVGVFDFLITITAPTKGVTYTQGEPVAAGYVCKALAGVSVIACAGPVANGAAIDTTTLGPHTFTVNAQYSNGLHASRSTSYTVIAAPGAPPIAAPLTAPILGNVRETAKTWREGNALAHISANGTRKKKLPLGTTFSFTLNQQARVGFAVTQQVAGHKVKGKCLATTRKNRKKPSCKRTVTQGTLSFTGHTGTDKVSFQGRISASKKLRPGRYTLVITATNAAGQHSTPKQLSFTIVK
jgi:hypothetical protein